MPGASLTQVLGAMERGDVRAAGELLPLVYDELRSLAARKLAGERPGQTLQATALVHEAFLRVIGADGDGAAIRWDSRAHFFAAAAEAMRRILIDNARRKAAVRHGGGRGRVELDDLVDLSLAAGGAPSDGTDLLALDEALGRLAKEDPVKSELVRLRYFAGLSLEEAAAVLHISRATAYRYWLYARAWLHDAILSDDRETGGDAIPHE